MNPDTLTTARWELMQSLTITEPTRDILIELLSDRLGFPPPGMPREEMEPVAPLPPVGTDCLIALCLGHARKGDQGAVSVGGVSEEEWHTKKKLLQDVQTCLKGLGIRSFIVDSYEGHSYAAAMTWLANELRRRGATAAVEFHFNAASASAWGHETLYHEFSRFGVKLAEMVNAQWALDLPGPNRGAKPRSSRDRGALFLSRTHCPAAILEPFFGSNAEDWKWFDANSATLAASTALGISNFSHFYATQKS